jgi:hypothetical protein
MTPQVDGPADVTKANAAARTGALVVALSACAAGKLQPTQRVLDALAHLAASAAFDLAVAA